MFVLARPSFAALLLLLVLLALCGCASLVAAQATPVPPVTTPSPTATVAVTYASYDSLSLVNEKTQAVRVCILNTSDHAVDFHHRPCIKTYYQHERTSWWHSYSSKYYYRCSPETSTIELMQCGNELPKGDYAGDECKPESNCVVRETYTAKGNFSWSHEIIDHRARWTGVFYSVNYYMRQEIWGHDINLRGRLCARPSGKFESPRIISSRPASQSVCIQKGGDTSRSFKLDCGTAAAPLTTPRMLHYDQSGSCGGASNYTVESWGTNNSCYRPEPYTDPAKYGSHGPRWVCFPGNAHHYAFVLDIIPAAAGAVSAVAAALLSILLLVLVVFVVT